MLTALHMSIGSNLILTGYAILFIARWIGDRRKKFPRLFDRGKAVLLANISVISLFAMYLASTSTSLVEWAIAFIFFVAFFAWSVCKFTQVIQFDNGGVWISGVFSRSRTRFSDIRGLEFIDGKELEEQGANQLVIRMNDGRKIDISGWSYLESLDRLLKSKGIESHANVKDFASMHERYHIFGLAALLISNLVLLLTRTVIY